MFVTKFVLVGVYSSVHIVDKLFIIRHLFYGRLSGLRICVVSWISCSQVVSLPFV